MFSYYGHSLLATLPQHNVRQAQAHQALQQPYQDATSGQKIQVNNIQVMRTRTLIDVFNFKFVGSPT